MTNAIITQTQTPMMSIAQAVDRYNSLVEFTKTVMTPGKDYGNIPGTDKPTLLKPGAEKLCTLFGFAPEFEMADKIVDFKGGLFYFQYRCKLIRDGQVIATGLGSCNTMEKKYRYRNAERVCPNCGKPTIIKGKAEYGGGWLCFGKKGGCGTKFAEQDKAITEQIVGQIENTEPFDLINTVDKMAQKRSLVAAILIGANASEFYTQDVEDLGYIEGEFSEVTEPELVVKKKAPVTRNEQNQVSSPVIEKDLSKPGAWPKIWLQTLTSKAYATNEFDAAGMLAKSFIIRPETPLTPAHIGGYGKHYRAKRDEGVTSEVAADYADSKLKAYMEGEKKPAPVIQSEELDRLDEDEGQFDPRDGMPFGDK